MSQDAAQRNRKNKQTTAALRQHLGQVKSRRDEAADPSSEVLTEFFDENDRLHDASNLITHQNLVAQSFLELSQAAKLQISRLQTSMRNFSPAVFVDQLAARTRARNSEPPLTQDSGQTQDSEALGEAFDFESFGREIWQHYRFAPRIDFMYGLREFKKKARTVRRAERSGPRPTQVAKPVAVKDNDASTKTEADKNIEKCSHELRKRKRLDLIDYTVNAQSFSKSVENLFYFSFLVKDGRAKLAASDEGIEASTLDHQRDSQHTPAQEESKQVILRFDYNRWAAAANAKRRVSTASAGR